MAQLGSIWTTRFERWIATRPELDRIDYADCGIDLRSGRTLYTGPIRSVSNTPASAGGKEK